VAAYIAEGYDRFLCQENMQYCRQVNGSLYEIIDRLSCAFDEEFFSKEDFKYYKSEIISCVQLVNGYINYLTKSKSSFVMENSINYNTNE